MKERHVRGVMKKGRGGKPQPAMLDRGRKALEAQKGRQENESILQGLGVQDSRGKAKVPLGVTTAAANEELIVEEEDIDESPHPIASVTANTVTNDMDVVVTKGTTNEFEEDPTE